MMHRLAILFIIVLINVVAQMHFISYKDPYPYEGGGAIIQVLDGTSPSFQVPGGIPVGLHRYDTVSASTHGLITLNFSTHEWIPQPLNNIFSVYNNPVIAVYWTDINPGVDVKAGLYYSVYQGEHVLLNRASDEVRYFTGDMTFNATWMFIATWHNASYYCNTCGIKERVTIQGVVVTDTVTTHAMFNYIDVNATPKTLNISIGWASVDSSCQNKHSFTDTAYSMSLQPSNTRDTDESCHCQSQPCNNSSTCISTENDYSCVCIDGYTGRHCEIDIDECQSQPCNNSVTCIDQVNNYTCVCMEGFTGRHCEIDIDECQSQSCYNSVTCIDQVNNYTCVCMEGFTGRHCEIDIDECQSQPCYNSVTCIDHVNNYTCVCMDGFTGRHCEIDIDECQSQPCNNSFTCIDQVNNFTCVCMDGFTGRHCEIDIDECQSQPCNNSFTCIEHVNNYTCVCMEGFTGRRCEVDIVGM